MSGFMVMVAGALSVAMTFAIVEWVARSAQPRRVFFIALGRERSAADEARVTRTRIVNAFFALIAVGAFLLPVPPLFKLVATTGGTFASLGWLMGETLGVVRSVRLEKLPTRFFVSLEAPPRIRDYLSVPLQVANLLVVVIPVVILAVSYGSLPATVPMQWGFDGEVTRLGAPSELWGLFAIMLFDLLVVWGVAYGVAQEKWALPEAGTDRYVALQQERRRTMVRMIEWIILLVNGGMGLSLAAAPFGAGGVTVIAVTLASLGSLGPLVVYLPRMLRVSSELREIAGTEVLGTRPDGWVWGGMVYFAPEDPALFVPKRIGVGQTLNFARPAAWALLVAVIAIPLAISLGIAAVG